MLTHEESERLMAAATEPKAPHLVNFIRLALYTGCRRGELLGLEWLRVDLDQGLLYLQGDHTKSGKRRSIPLNDEAKLALTNQMAFRIKHCPSSPWVFSHLDGRRIQDIKRSFGTACAKAGLTDFRIHDLRHTCAAWLVTSGVRLEVVRDLLGHSTIAMTERYAHLAPERVREAVTLLSGKLSRSGHGHKVQEAPVGV